MTRYLSILGDSLMDAGNASWLGRRFGVNPFAATLYSGGGNVKASDGLVLGEHIALRLGADPGSSQLVNKDTLTGLVQGGFGVSQIRNYAVAGATTGPSGSRLSGLEGFPIGLSSQAATMIALGRGEDDHDVVIAAGSNDLIDYVSSRPRMREVLEADSRKSLTRLSAQASRLVLNKLSGSVDMISGQVDELVLLGLPPLGALPYVHRRARGLSRTDGDQLVDFLNASSERVNRGLERRFGYDPNVLIIDGHAVWRSLGRLDFLDGFHPTSNTAGSLASEIVGLIRGSHLDTFGF